VEFALSSVLSLAARAFLAIVIRFYEAGPTRRILDTRDEFHWLDSSSILAVLYLIS
jgi:HAMP domain-containing protein